MANQDDFRRTSQNEPIGVVLDKLLKIYHKDHLYHHKVYQLLYVLRMMLSRDVLL